MSEAGGTVEVASDIREPKITDSSKATLIKSGKEGLKISFKKGGWALIQ